MACLLVHCILLAVPAQVAMADSTPAAGAGPSTGVGGYTATLGGTASTAANTTTITAPNGSVFDWQNFDIGSGHTVQHPGMGATDAVLHRINVTAGWGDGDATGINGNLSSPGYLFVVNPMGIVMGADALISANRFIASGLNISNFSDFISGSTNELQFDGYDASTLGVELQSGGQISANAVALIGKTVVNDGTINSDSVVLAAGERVYLAVTNDSGKLAVDVTDLLTTVPADNKVTNNGTINATDGNVLLAAGDIYSLAISGVEDLAAVSNENIELDTGGGNFSADNIVLTGDFDDSGTGNIDINTGITLNGGTFTSEGVDFDNTGGIITTNDGKVDIQNTGNVTIGANINAGTGDVDIDGGTTGVAASIIDGGGTIASSGTINLEASGNIGTSSAAIDTDTTAPLGTIVKINANSTVAGDIFIDNTGAVTFGTVSTTASDIEINNAGHLTIESLEAGGTGDVTLTTTNFGNVSVGDVKALGDQITIDSAGAIMEHHLIDADADLTADTLDLSAVGAIGIVDPVETAATTIIAMTVNPGSNMADIVLNNDNSSPTSLTASTVGSDSWIVFNQTGGGELTLTDVSTVNGLIDISAEAGDIVATLVNAGGSRDITLSTTTSGDVVVDDVTALDDQITINSAGAIRENGNDATADLTADTLDLTANDGIGDFLYVETAANTITAKTIDNTQAGANIWLSNDNASPTSLTASTVSENSWVAFKQKGGGELTLTDVSTVNGGINVEADAGNIVAAQVDKNGFYGSVYLTTINSGDITVGSVNAGGSLIDIDSAGAIDNDAAPDGVANAVGGVIDLTANSGGIGQSTTLEVTATTALNADTTADSANINIDSIGDLPVGLVDAGTGDVTLDSSGNIMGVTDDTTADVAGSTINLTAAVGGIGNALDVKATTALNADTVAGDDSAIIIDSIGDLPVGLVDAGTGDVTLDSSGNIMGVTDDTTADVAGSTINLTAAVGGIGNALDVKATTALNADTVAGDDSAIVIDSIGDLPVGLVDAGTGDVTLDSSGNIMGVTDDTTADVAGSTIYLTAAVGGIGNALDVKATTALNADTTADSANINIDSIGDLPVGLVNAAGGDVTLNSDSAIRDDVDDSGAPTVDVVGDTINLTAVSGGIGTPAAG
ncbi:MAG: filamentous hemagglutinin N-terminal domain-containing protein, partial [Planctomycetes bacterium]|nr:filamentous hemagglutinin N-terminal domain-containing protein [Planctomycetota bacterium]